MTNEFTKELMAITQYAVASNTNYTESKVREMLKSLLNHFEQITENEKCEEEIKNEKTHQLFLKDRKQLIKIFDMWCKENNADKYSQENVIAWMKIKGFIDTKSVKEFLEEIKDEQIR